MLLTLLLDDDADEWLISTRPLRKLFRWLSFSLNCAVALLQVDDADVAGYSLKIHPPSALPFLERVLMVAFQERKQSR